MKAETAAMALLVAAESAHAFSSYLPSYFTIKTFALEGSEEEVQQKIAYMRSGYKPAAIFSVVLGGAVSLLTKSPVPLVASTIATGFMICQYEAALPPEYRLINGTAGGLLSWPT